VAVPFEAAPIVAVPIEAVDTSPSQLRRVSAFDMRGSIGAIDKGN
jgi:hypothetical protein